MSRGRLDLAYLLDDAVEELASLHELNNFVVVVGVVLEELVDFDYIRVPQLSQNARLAEARTRDSATGTQYCESGRLPREVIKKHNKPKFQGSLKRGGQKDFSCETAANEMINPQGSPLCAFFPATAPVEGDSASKVRRGFHL